MKTQAETFFDQMQEQLKDPNFGGMWFQDGTMIHPMTLRQITDPEALLAFIQQVAERAEREAAGGPN